MVQPETTSFTASGLLRRLLDQRSDPREGDR